MVDATDLKSVGL